MRAVADSQSEGATPAGSCSHKASTGHLNRAAALTNGHHGRGVGALFRAAGLVNGNHHKRGLQLKGTDGSQGWVGWSSGEVTFAALRSAAVLY